MKRLLLPLIDAITLPNAGNASEKAPYQMTETEAKLD